ncbi:MAG: alkaline phosphatase, partial [Planctomycetota bacterium]
MRPIALFCIAVTTLATAAVAQIGSVVFIHPDGASAATWAATRALYVGPDRDLNWDRLPAIALYRGHMRDSLTATSNGGATTHAYGIKVASDAFGMTAGGDRAQRIADENGNSTSIAHQALRNGLRVGLVQSGIAPEPGTAAFLSSVPSRREHEKIAADLIASGAHVLLSGGERHFLPEGTEGIHGPGERTDGRNLIDEARAAGYTVVRTREQLAELPASTDRVLGLFAWSSTFNDKDEQTL